MNSDNNPPTEQFTFTTQQTNESPISDSNIPAGSNIPGGGNIATVKPKKRSLKALWISLVAAGGLFILSFVAYIVLRPANTPEQFELKAIDDNTPDSSIPAAIDVREDTPEQFEFTISHDSTPGGSTTISVHGNEVIIEEYTPGLNPVKDEGTTTTESYQYSDENIDKLFNFYSAELVMLVINSPNIKRINVPESFLDSYQKGVIYALRKGENQFAHDVQCLRYQVYIETSSSLSDFYILKVPEEGSPFVVKRHDYEVEYYDLNFSSKNIKTIDNYMTKIATKKEDGERWPYGDIDYTTYITGSTERRRIIEAIINNDESLISS